MLWEVITPPAAALSWAELKAFLRITDEAEQPVVMALAAAALDYAADIMECSLGVQTIRASYGPGERFDLPRGPVVELLTVEDDDGTDLAPTAVLTRDATNDTMTVGVGHTPPVTVTYTAGLASLPAAVRQACLIDVANRYENRETAEPAKGLYEFYRRRRRGERLS